MTTSRFHPPRFFLLLVILVSVFGAGTVDVLFTDVIPLRPYDTFFHWIPQFSQRADTGNALKGAFITFIMILIVASLLPSIANLTTGITLAHSGFTVNPNITGTPGYVSTIRVVPLVALGVGLGFALDELGGTL